jgi:hypothetical protein
MECTRNDLSELLAMALYPKDFPDVQEEIAEHVKECSQCRDELEKLQQLSETLRENRAELAPCVSACPEATALVDFSVGETADPTIKTHIEHCSACREHAQLIRQLASEGSTVDRPAAPNAEEKLMIRNAVVKQYGQPLEKPSFSLSAAFWSFVSIFDLRSIALGAVVTAVLLAVLVPWAHKEPPSRLVLSDARWESAPQTMIKGGELLGHPKSVALVILVQGGADLSAKEVSEIYGKIDLAQRLGDQYDLVSPVDIKKALGTVSEKVANIPDFARTLFDKTDVDYVLLFRIGGSGTRLSLAGSLFKSADKPFLGSASWDGIPKDRLPSSIMRITAELLAGAEQS